MPPAPCDVVVVGGGAAGLMAAAAASRGGARVALIERMDQPGRKLSATGGGRGNLTLLRPPREMAEAFGRGKRFARGAIHELPPEAVRTLFAGLGCPTIVGEDGRVYPASERATDVTRALVNACEDNAVQILCATHVTELCVEDGRIAAVTTDEGRFTCRALILATGGQGYPALGSDGSGFGLAHALGHALTPPSQALVPLHARETWIADLAGLALTARISAPQRKISAGPGEILFTHRGLSGPLVLDHSGELLASGTLPLEMRVSILGRDVGAWRQLFGLWREKSGKQSIRAHLAQDLPNRFVDVLLRRARISAGITAATLKRDDAKGLADLLGALPLTITGGEGWERAMLTRGGVRTAEVDPRTLQSRLVPGLFLAGEVLDLDGPSGGYNLSWAFASGFVAGQSAAQASRT